MGGVAGIKVVGLLARLGSALVMCFTAQQHVLHRCDGPSALDATSISVTMVVGLGE